MIETIVKTVCEAYGITPEALKSKTRKHPLPEARRMAFHFMLQYKVDADIAAESLNVHRTYHYRAMLTLKNEIMLYSHVAVNAAKIHLELEKLTIKQ